MEAEPSNESILITSKYDSLRMSKIACLSNVGAWSFSFHSSFRISSSAIIFACSDKICAAFFHTAPHHSNIFLIFLLIGSSSPYLKVLKRCDKNHTFLYGEYFLKIIIRTSDIVCFVDLSIFSHINALIKV